MRKAFLILLVLYGITGYTQKVNQFVETLQKQIDSAKTDSLRVDKMLELSMYYYVQENNLDSMIGVLSRTIPIAKKGNYLLGLSRSYGALGIAYMNKEETDKALENNTKSYEYANELGDSEYIFLALMRLSGYYEKTNSLTKSLQMALDGAKTAEKANDQALKANAFYRIASIFSMQDRDNKTKEYLDKANHILKSHSDKVPVVIQRGIYLSTTDYFNRLYFQNPDDQQLKDSLLLYIEKGIDYGKTIQNPMLIANQLALKGKIYVADEKVKQGKGYYQEALTYRNHIDPITLKNLYVRLAQIATLEGNKQQALMYKDSILKDIEETTSHYRRAELYNTAYTISKEIKDYGKALEYHEKMLENNTKAIDEAHLKAISELEIKYETEKKDAEIVTQKLENETIKRKATTNYFLLGIAALMGLSILGFLYYKKKNKVLATELNLAKTKTKLHRLQLNPHFISNSINTIYPFLYDKSDPNKAAAYLSDLSQMIRSILESTFDTSWAVGEEIRFIEQYCKVWELKISIPFQLSVECDESLHQIQIPSLITQTFVENCFVHGFATMDSPAEIKIEMKKLEDLLQIKITDNGQFSEKPKDDNHVSRSNQIVEQRIRSTYTKEQLPNDFLVYGPYNSSYQVIIKLPIVA